MYPTRPYAVSNTQEDHRSCMAVAVGMAELGAMTAEREVCFSTFVVSQRDRARRLAWRLVGGDDAAAEDVTQDAFVTRSLYSGPS